MRERLIAALIPDSLGASGAEMAAPLPVLPTLSWLKKTAPSALLVSTTRMDRSGRVHERLLLDELGWHPGRQLDMDTMHAMILIAATPAGRHVIDSRGAIGLPAALRRLCGIECGPPLVLTAAVPEQMMVIHPAATVAHLLAEHYTNLIQTDQTRTEPTLATKPNHRDSS